MFATHFSIDNIPFGIASSGAHPRRSAVTRIEDTVVFLDELAGHELLECLPPAVIKSFSHASLNDFAAFSKPIQRQTRAALQALLSQTPRHLPPNSTAHIKDVAMHLPMVIGDFTDFSCSKEHVLNAGEAIMKKRFLPQGFLHFPIGYASRTSSIVVSGTPCVRPRGQFHDQGGAVIYGPTKQMDYELEIACIVGKPSELGKSVRIQDADEYIFGLVMLNDWSARDIQALEMMPLGPLNGKSFMTSMSPWVITLEALKSFAVRAPPRELKVASYLQHSKSENTYDVHLTADLLVNGYATRICKSELKTVYWTFRDVIAHQTSNGCNLRPGDLLATGTISGESDDSHGCLVELTKGGQESFKVEGGLSRVYLEDGDVVRISAYAGDGVGFGECIGELLPSL